jgi:hypothetical protein
VQAPQEPPSIRHSKDEPPSLEEKSKLAPPEADGSEGEESMVVCGAVRSIVKLRLFAVSTLPAASVARTRTV